ncbi:MAG: murein L,D-transpeptidase [Flavobacteriaceae bacterium]
MMTTRRQFSRLALAALASGTALASGGAFAQGINLAATIDPNGANWGQGFDPSSKTISFDVDSHTPIASPSTIGNIQYALDSYTRMAQAGGWPKVPDAETLRIGQRGPAISVLRQRLAATGDIASEAGIGDTFDTFVQAAVVRFQTRHGILADGIVSTQTFHELNVPVEQRIEQLRVNAARLQELGIDLGERYIMVNIPGAQIEVVEQGRVVQRHTAIVGKVDRPSPLLTSKISEINFNPYWNAPESIVRRDIIPKMQEDPEYLSKFNIRVYDQQGNELQPETVDWNTVDSTKILLRQDPGDVNSMGFMKINFPNKHAVYMHDTPSQELFGTNGRFYSSGCVRVQNIRELAAWILQPNGEWPRSRIDQVIRSGERLDVPVESRPSLYFAYVTAWVTDDGMVNFRPDIYNRDAAGLLANDT